MKDDKKDESWAINFTDKLESCESALKDAHERINLEEFREHIKDYSTLLSFLRMKMHECLFFLGENSKKDLVNDRESSLSQVYIQSRLEAFADCFNYIYLVYDQDSKNKSHKKEVTLH